MTGLGRSKRWRVDSPAPRGEPAEFFGVVVVFETRRRFGSVALRWPWFWGLVVAAAVAVYLLHPSKPKVIHVPQRIPLPDARSARR